MSMFWEGFWFVLFTLSNANGTFFVYTAIFSSPWQRSLATVTWTTILRWIFKAKHIFEPICLDIAVVTLHQLLVSSWGLKWALMVALGLSALAFLTGYLVLRPNHPLNLQWWLVFLFITVNIEWVMIFLSSCGQTEGEEDKYCKINGVVMGLLLIAHSLFFYCMHHEVKRRRLSRIMAARIMIAQIKGLGSFIPIGRRHPE